MDLKYLVMIVFTLAACCLTFVIATRVNIASVMELLSRYEHERELVFQILLQKKRHGIELVHLYNSALDAPGVRYSPNAYLVSKAIFHYYEDPVSRRFVDDVIGGRVKIDELPG